MQVPARNKYSPLQLYRQGYNPPGALVNFNHVPNDQSTMAQIDNYTKDNQIRKASLQMIKDTIKSPNYIFHIGDYVRVKLLALMPKMRMRKKSTFGDKLSAIKYSLNVYRIHAISPATTFDGNSLPLPNIWHVARYRYVLVTTTVPPLILCNDAPGHPGRPAIHHMGVLLPAISAFAGGPTTPKLFWGSDLIHVNPPAMTTPSHVLPATTVQIERINKL